jgi:predicted enzyme related to lactoylglutathione lyase
MSEREHYPAGVPCWVDTIQTDPRGALDFYREVFGWEFAGPGPMSDGGEYFVARVGGRDVAGISSVPADSGPPMPVWNTYVSVDSADEAAEKARSGGGAVIAGPLDAPPAGRMAVLADPAGAPFLVWEPGERQGAQRINEPSAWAMSALATSDPQAAVDFYGNLFGWQADSFDAGGSEGFLMRLPGFVGGEPGQPVPRDVVAVMVPAGDRPAAWSVDFWIDDADEAAARASAHGGSVIVPPHDQMGFRNTVLADPQGAVFSVSQLLTAH